MSRDTNLSLAELYDKHNINKEFDHPPNVTETESYSGEGKYPPDWDDSRNQSGQTNGMGGRRAAIYEYQDGKCARCQRDLSNVEEYHCHHFRPLSKGGKHDLNNLVGLCGPCHSLIHPNNDELNADWEDAPLFPSPDADPRVATIRVPEGNAEFKNYLPELMLISNVSQMGENQFANSEKTLSMSPGDALSAAENWEKLCADLGFTSFETLQFTVTDQKSNPINEAKITLKVETTEFGSYKAYSYTNKRGREVFQIMDGSGIYADISKEEYATETISGTIDGETSIRIELNKASGKYNPMGEASEAGLIGKISKTVVGLVLVLVVLWVAIALLQFLLNSGVDWLFQGTIAESVGRLIGIVFLSLFGLGMLEGMFG